MRTKLFTLFIFTFFASIVSAQNARAILDKASDAYYKTGGVTVSFALDIKDTKAKNTYSYDGKASMKGNKFKIEIPDFITWFDGTTQWVYNKDTEEISITTPTSEELQSISPIVLFSMYKKGFNLSYKGEKKVNGKAVDEIELTPQQKKSDFSKIIVQINKAANTFSRITLVDKKGVENILTIKNYQTSANMTDATFRFDKKNYPNADIFDIR